VPAGYITEEIPIRVDFIQDGEGDVLKDNDIVYIHYRGTLADGTLFDFSRDTNRSERWKGKSQEEVPPMKVVVGVTGLVEGFTQGLRQLRPGSVIDLSIPPHLGYKGKSMKKIPAYSTLNFRLEVIDVFRAGEIDQRELALGEEAARLATEAAANEVQV
jgi:peptidylprolyl isomerase